MKRMRNFFLTLSAVLVLTLSVVLGACGTSVKNASVTLLKNDEKTVVVRADKTDTTASLFDALVTLKDAGEMDFTYEDGQYGAYIQTVNGTTVQGNEFWAVYTSLAEYEGVVYSSVDYGMYDYEGAKLGSASVGVSSLPLVEEKIYVVTLETYQ